jgi:hypothetical protein
MRDGLVKVGNTLNGFGQGMKIKGKGQTAGQPTGSEKMRRPALEIKGEKFRQVKRLVPPKKIEPGTRLPQRVEPQSNLT